MVSCSKINIGCRLTNHGDHVITCRHTSIHQGTESIGNGHYSTVLYVPICMVGENKNLECFPPHTLLAPLQDTQYCNFTLSLEHIVTFTPWKENFWALIPIPEHKKTLVSSNQSTGLWSLLLWTHMAINLWMRGMLFTTPLTLTKETITVEKHVYQYFLQKDVDHYVKDWPWIQETEWFFEPIKVPNFQELESKAPNQPHCWLTRNHEVPYSLNLGKCKLLVKKEPFSTHFDLGKHKLLVGKEPFTIQLDLVKYKLLVRKEPFTI